MGGSGARAAPDDAESAQASAALERVDEGRGDVEAGLLGDLLEAGRAGDVDLGEAVADDVEADQQQAARRQRRPDRLGDLAVARRERLGHALAADGEVAADLAALRDARQRMRHRLAVDHEDALVAGDDLGAGSAAPSPSCAPLRFSVSMMLPRFRPSAPTRKMPMPPMPSSGFRMMSLVLGVEALDRRLVAGDERRRDELRELEDRELFRMVAQRRAAC